MTARTKERGIVASILTAFTYRLATPNPLPLTPTPSPNPYPDSNPNPTAFTCSGTVNSSLDKFGKIDPATSTVLIGMFLGNTFAF